MKNKSPGSADSPQELVKYASNLLTNFKGQYLIKTHKLKKFERDEKSMA